MELTSFEMLAAMAAVCTGALVQGTLGFGLAVVATPVLFIIEPKLVPGSVILMGLLVGLLTASRYFGSLRLADLKYAVAGRVPGSVLGAALLAVAPPESMSLFLGVCVLLAVLGSLSPYKVQVTNKTLFTAGVLSGIMGTTSAIGGPAIALVMQNQSGDRIRAQLSAYFVISCLISLVILQISGLFGWWQLKHAFYLVPAVLAGHWLAGKMVQKVNQKTMRTGLLVICSVAGVSAIASGLR